MVESLFATLLVSFASLVGLFTLGVRRNLVHKFVIFLVSLAAGTLLGDVFFHIIPEIYEESPEGNELPFAIIAGIMAFFILEKFLHWRHCHMEETKNHVHPLAINNIVADGFHNFIDGLIIGGSFMVSNEIGIATTIAVMLHEIPQEIGDFGVLVHAGMKVSQALILNFASALLAVLGTLVAFAMGETVEGLNIILLAFAAGGFIYIAASDLFPEIKHEQNWKKSLLQVLFVLIGLTAMFLLTFMESH